MYLYTKILVDEAIDVIKNITNTHNVSLVIFFLNSTYFTYRGNIYEQVHGVVMGSPLSPIVENIYMDNFENMVIDSFPFTPKEWNRYVDDIFFKWRHGKENLNDLLTHLNNLSNT